MRFFFDRCVPIRMAKMVRAVHEPVHAVLHQDEDPNRFPKTMSDVDWLKILGKDDAGLWTVISGDGKILKNKVERQVLESVGLPYFLLEGHWHDMQFDEYAWKFMKVWPMIIRTACAPLGKKPHFRVHGWTQIKVTDF